MKIRKAGKVRFKFTTPQQLQLRSKTAAQHWKVCKYFSTDKIFLSDKRESAKRLV
jgi:hypothetical protein